MGVVEVGVESPKEDWEEEEEEEGEFMAARQAELVLVVENCVPRGSSRQRLPRRGSTGVSEARGER